ncbi:hypothetical protein [Thermococcus sp.]
MNLGNLLKTYLEGIALWGLLGILLRGSLGDITIILVFLLALANLATVYGEPRGYLVRTLAFLSSSVVLLLSLGGWVKGILAVLFLFVGLAYLVSYPLYRRGNDFLPRNMLGVALAGGVVGFATFYGPSSLKAIYFLDFLIVVALTWIAFVIGKYVSLRFGSGNVVAVDTPPTEVGKADSWLREAENTVRQFVEYTNKTPLVVVVSRVAPRNVKNGDVERALEPIIGYQPDLGGPLTPVWLRLLYMERERRKRKQLVNELFKKIKAW